MKVKSLVFILILLIIFSFSFAQWVRKPDVPNRINWGGGITYGRGYIFAIVGNGNNDFYAFDIIGDSWITDLDELPEEIESVGAITYGKNQTYAFGKFFKLEHLFVLVGIEGVEDEILIYTFEDTMGTEGDWDYYELPENIELGHGASITFRPTNYIYWDPTLWCYVITLGELYFTQGNMTGNFYCLPIKQLFSPVVCDTAIACDWVFPPDNGVLDAMKIFFRWETIPNANYYYLQVDKNPDFSSPILDITTDKNIYNSKKIFSPGVYYWRIRPDYSPIWSQTRKFQIMDTLIPKRGLPDGINAGGSIAYHCIRDESTNASAESIFCLIGGGRTNFYCYSVHQDSWFRVAFSLTYQNVGSSITSSYQSTDSMRKQQLLAIFGRGIYPYIYHWIYYVNWNEWIRGCPINTTLGPGASITFDWREGINKAYLVVGDNRRGFYVNNNPFFENEEIYSSQQSLTIDKKTKILFNSSGIVFSYSCEKPSYGEISVYNLYGKKIKTLFKDKMEKKEYQLIWDKKDEKGRRVSSSIYFIIINTKEKKGRIKIIIP